MKKYLCTLMTLAILILFSCTGKKLQVSQMQNTDHLLQQWNEAWNSSDPATVMGLLSENATLFMDTVYSGMDDLENNFVLPSVKALRNLKCEKTVEFIADDMVSLSGYYTHDWARNDSIIGTTKGYYSLLWQRQADSTWKISCMHIH